MSDPAANAIHKGGCLCGAVRYEISAEPMFGGFCQCRDCQRHSGVGHAAGMGFPESAVKIAGKLSYYDSKADSGATISRGFCPKCGSRLVVKSSGMPGLTMISPGGLDDSDWFKPGRVIFASRGRAWDHLDPALARFPETSPRPPK